MIEVKNISKKFKKREVISDLSLKIEQGDFVCIFGDSGCGKTTLLNLIGALDKVDEGEITFDTYNTRKHYMYIRKNFVSYVFQNFALQRSKTVLQNLKFALLGSKLSSTEKNELIREELKKVGLLDRLNSYVYELSGGEQQRIALVRAVIKPHKVILADEPTGNLDEANADIVLKHLKELNDKGETIIIVSHDKSVAKYATKVVNL